MSARPSDYRDRLGPAAGPDPSDQPTPRRRGGAPARYGRYSVHLTDDLHAWARRAAVQAADDLGTSATVTSSEVVRAALTYFREAVEGGRVDLGEVIAAQAHEEARRLPGRRARGGMPRLA